MGCSLASTADDFALCKYKVVVVAYESFEVDSVHIVVSVVDIVKIIISRYQRAPTETRLRTAQRFPQRVQR